jgi:hypothetical protein
MSCIVLTDFHIKCGTLQPWDDSGLILRVLIMIPVTYASLVLRLKPVHRR